MADIPLQFPSLGNALMQGAHAAYFTGKARLENDEEQRRQQAQPYVQKAMQGDQGAMAQVASGDPKTAMVLTQALTRMDANQRARAKATADWSAHGADTVLQQAPKDQPAMYQRMLDEGRALGHDVSRLPQQWDNSVPGLLRFHRGQAKDFIEADQKQKDRDLRLQIHNTHGGGSAGGLIDLPDGGAPASGPPAVAPPQGPAPAPNARVSELPPGVATPPSLPPTQAASIVPPQNPVQTAQATPGTIPPPMPGSAAGSVTADYQPTAQPTTPPAGPLKPEGVTPGAPPVGGGPAPAAPKKYAPYSIIYEDPAALGGRPQARQQPNGSFKLEEGPGNTVQYKLPDGTRVFYSPHLKAPLTENGVPSDVGHLHGDEFRESPFYKTLPFTDRNAVEGLLDGSIPISALAKRGGGGKGGVGGLPINTLMGIAKQLDPSWSPNEGEQGKRFAASLIGNGQNAQTVTAINVVPQHAADLVKLTDAMNQNNPQAVQGIINKLKEQFGDTAVPNMEAARKISALEFLKAAVGPGALNVTLEKEFLDSIKAAGTAAQTRTVVAGYVDKVMGRAHYLQDLADTYGVKQPIITPRAKADLEFLKGAPGTTVHGTAIPQQEPSLWDKGKALFEGKSSGVPKLGANGEGYDSIPAGGQYIAPDGSTRTKGGK